MNPKFQQGKELPPEVIAIVVGVVCVVFLIAYTIKILFCLSMSKALSRCAERNRMMQPGLVWLYLIPCLDLVWLFFIVIQVPASLQREFEDRGRDEGGDYGKTLGLIAAIVLVVSVLISWIPFIGLCGSVGSLVCLVLLIIFWVKIASYSGQLGESSSSSAGAYGDDD